ncbi:hypothetical protein G3A_14020 [Bacillus sp. 17376]|uniref:Uncharacterized protein n=1 Tax=Mesobacillus boroniphilus JCM 21738 TaxID=1294265 RepID=W4RNA1_9BACI|nr:hypothetical protein [Mesobacillus boroniphilus]ESU31927.1 hypothetical protein G3A_14020 [Bacillus sp. 17376]GAE45791.1 hypothetical protein JCM21738_2635 [Mesobacillus boroniphilus JCM 21738]
MFWFFIGIFFANLLLGLMQAQVWLVILVNLVIFLVSMFKSFYPVLFEKDPDKIMSFMKKSKQPQFQFYYYFFNDQLDEAEDKLHKIKSPFYQKLNHVNLLGKRKQYDEAEEMARGLKDNMYKWYSLAGIAIEQGNRESYRNYKEKVRNPFYRRLLELEEMVHDGKKEMVLAELESMIPNLRGLKLLSVIQYKQDLLKRNED